MAGSEAVREVVIGIPVVRLRTDQRGPLLKELSTRRNPGPARSGLLKKLAVPRTKHNRGFDGPAPVAEKSVNLKIGARRGWGSISATMVSAPQTGQASSGLRERRSLASMYFLLTQRPGRCGLRTLDRRQLHQEGAKEPRRVFYLPLTHGRSWRDQGNTTLVTLSKALC